MSTPNLPRICDAVHSIVNKASPQAEKRHGVVIEVVPQTADGDADTAALEELILKGTKPKLVAISHIGTGSGAAPYRHQLSLPH